ncbi:MAG: cytochrome c oxidase subunit II [Actinomycetota bacterium]|nr:cytochrome c oxidase subunit II [Actinomycetota bacterium]
MTRGRWGRAAVILAVSVATIACAPSGAPSALDPKGSGARRIEGLWWLMFWISLAVFAVVVAFLVVAYVRGRREQTQPTEARWGGPFVVVSGIVAPSLILAGVFVVSLNDMMALSSPPQQPGLTIDVIGHDWWWEARYEESGAVTANEIHIPTGESIQLRLTTDDVIHSFWVPQLQAKTDLISGEVNSMWLQADEPGRYRGQCAEFCGLQHANMIFYVVAEDPAEFEAWLANEAGEADDPSDAAVARGESVFLQSSCAGCHAVRGTEADSDLGPDLTHLAGRETIASGVLENTRSELAQWIIDPQGAKPGAIMPPTELSSAELDALLDYLESLD